MKSVMLSIKPKWCELIASGKKTVEVRKTRPKIETPFKCYIYCTIGGGDLYSVNGRVQKINEIEIDLTKDTVIEQINGKVIGEFVCDFINKYTAEFVEDDCYENIRQIWEDDDFTIVTTNEDENPNNCFLCNASCLSFEDIKKYIGVNFHEIPFYGWHISDLVIYDKPRELSEFRKPEMPTGLRYENDVIKRPPQSWLYVEEK